MPAISALATARRALITLERNQNVWPEIIWPPVRDQCPIQFDQAEIAQRRRKRARNGWSL